nr:PREDICTED: proline dehydrogenase 1, mitochondrial-like [Latimeria chalumnae]|eukprot:XP_014354428.1 PREDICTED: proline dehydrogenase 1, mitochondrial-like [Latimeria chalumnae]
MLTISKGVSRLGVGFRRRLGVPVFSRPLWHSSPASGSDIDFRNPEESYRSKRTSELLRALVVFNLCAVDILVDRNKELMEWAQRLLGRSLFQKLMKVTFYGQFVAGEDLERIKPLIKRNKAFGVGSILDYSVEEDLGQSEAEEKEKVSCMSKAETQATSQKREVRVLARKNFGDRWEKVPSARMYFYTDEAKCDQHLEVFLKCVDAAGAATSDGFAAIKLTALGRPQFLLQFSEVLVRWRHFFEQLAADQRQAERSALRKCLDRQGFTDSLAKLGVASRDETGRWFTLIDTDKSGSVDLLQWNRLLDSDTRISKLMMGPSLQSGKLEPLLLNFTKEEEEQMKRMITRMHTIASSAMTKGVRLLIDAEQTYFQPAISRLAMEVMREFNKQRPIIYNTYQCYLKEACDSMAVDLELSRREGWHFGAKLVRGAYMEQERKRAAEIGYPDPINLDYKATSDMYFR